MGLWLRNAEGNSKMIPEWTDVVIVKPSNNDGCHAGTCGRVFMNGMEIKNVSKLEMSEVIGDDDIPSVTLTLEPKMIRILLDTDFTVDEQDVLQYNGPRKLRIKREV